MTGNQKVFINWQILIAAMLMILELDYGIDIDYLFEKISKKNEED